MMAGVTRLRLAACDSAVSSLRRPLAPTPAREAKLLSLGSGSASIAAEYMCIAASATLTMIGASPSSGVPLATAPRFLRGARVRTDPSIESGTRPEPSGCDMGSPQNLTPIRDRFNRRKCLQSRLIGRSIRREADLVCRASMAPAAWVLTRRFSAVDGGHPWASRQHSTTLTAIGETAGGGLLVLRAHVVAGGRIVSITSSRLTRWVPSPRSAILAALIAFPAEMALRSIRNLHQPADGVARQPEAVFHRDLRRVLHLLPECRRGSRRARRRPSTPPSPLRPGSPTSAPEMEARSLYSEPIAPAASRKLDRRPRRGRPSGRAVVQRVVQHRRDDAGRAVGRGGDHAAAARSPR